MEGYERQHPGAKYLIEFADAESYVCLFDTAYDSENSGELDIDEDNLLYDEFHQVVMEIIDVRSPGLRPYNEFLMLDYRDWPERITDLDRGIVVYPETT